MLYCVKDDTSDELWQEILLFLFFILKMLSVL